MYNEILSKYKNRKSRKGFSLVELVVVILIIAILAVAVFAGGSAVIKKSQVSRTVSDLHNFSVAVESTLNSNPKVAHLKTNADGIDKIMDALNENLQEDYKFTKLSAAQASGNITWTGASGTDEAYLLAQSAKTDAWGNPYYLVMDTSDRNSEGKSDFFVEVISAGPDAKTAVDGAIGGVNASKADDIFLLTQYTDGDVTAVTYDLTKSSTKIGENNIAKGTAQYTGTDATKAPINF